MRVLDQFTPPAPINKREGPDKGGVSIKLAFPSSRGWECSEYLDLRETERGNKMLSLSNC